MYEPIIISQSLYIFLKYSPYVQYYLNLVIAQLSTLKARLLGTRARPALSAFSNGEVKGSLMAPGLSGKTDS